MRNLKRALSLALASVMVLGLMVVGSSAASKDFADGSEIEYTEAVDVMTAIDVLEGDETGHFNPTDTLNREQAAKIIASMLLGPDNADKLGKNETIFTDVAKGSWAAGYISYCSGIGILVGDGTGKFLPQVELTGVAFGKMLLMALGYDADIEHYTGSDWAVNVASDMVDAGIDVDGVTFSDPLTREQAAQMAFNTLTANMVEYDQRGVQIGDVTIGASKAEAYAWGNNTVRTEAVKYDSKADGIQQFCEKYFKDLTKTPIANSDLTGAPVAKWEYKNDKIGEYSDEADVSYVMDKSETVNKMLADKDYYNDKDAAAKGVYINGESKTGAEVLYAGDVVDIYEDDNGDVKNVIVLRYSYAKIDEVDTDVNSDQEDDGISAIISLVDAADADIGSTYYNNTTDDDDEDKILTGYTSAYVEGASLAVALDSKDKVIDSYVIDAITGTPSAAKSFGSGENGGATPYTKGSVTVDGTEYKYVGKAQGVPSSYDSDFYKDEVSVYATKEGYLLALDDVDATSLDDVYYVTGFYKTNDKYGTSNTWYAQAVALKDGTVSDIKIDSDFVGESKDTGMDTVLKEENSDKLYKADGTIGGAEQTETKAENAKESTLYVSKDLLYTFDSDGKPTPWTKDGDIKLDDNKSLDGDFKSGDKTISIATTGKFYVKDSTTFINIDDVGDNLEVKVGNGAISAPSGTDALMIADGTDALYVVYVAKNLAGVDSDDLLYVAETPTEKTADGWKTTVYFMNELKETTIYVDGKKEAPTVGFKTFQINSDGAYELKDKSGGGINKEVTSTTTNYGNLTIESRRGTMLEDKTNEWYKSTEYGDAVVIDTRSDSARENTTWTDKIANATQLGKAIDAGEVTVDVYVEDGEIVFVAVKSTEATYAMNSKTETLANGVTVTATPDVAAAKNGVQVTYTITVRGNNTVAGSKVTIKDLSGVSGLTVQGSPTNCSDSGLTLTFTSSGDVNATYTTTQKVTVSSAAVTPDWDYAAS